MPKVLIATRHSTAIAYAVYSEAATGAAHGAIAIDFPRRT